MRVYYASVELFSTRMARGEEGTAHCASFPSFEQTEEVAARPRQIREAQARFTDLLASTAHLMVTYEELTGHRSRSDIPEDVGRRILDFLNVPYRRMVTTLIKTAPEPPRLSGT